MECRPQTKGKPAVACRVRCEVPRFRAAFNANLLKEVFYAQKQNRCTRTRRFRRGVFRKKRYFTAQKIAYLAVFVALNVVVGIFSPRLGTLKITLTYTVCFLRGIFRADCRRTCRRTRRRDRLFRRRRVCAKPGDSLRVGAYRRYSGAHVVY